MTKQERMYCDYIENHVNNVYRAYQLIGDILHEDLDFDDLSLVKRVNTHDTSKWSEDEFEAYRQNFYPSERERTDEDMFEKAWQHHYKNNDHHPEHYVFNYAFLNGEIKQLAKEMPDEAIAEMFCDWTAMSLNFKTSLKKWYDRAMKDGKFVFNEKTLEKVDRIMSKEWVKDIHLK